MAEAAEDRILTKVLGVSLQFQSTEKSGIIFLADLAQELIDEGVQALLLSKQNLDRAMMSRLMMEPAEGLQRPFFYLLDVYARAGKELRNTQTLKDKLVMEQLQQAVMLAQELAVSHANLALTVELFPKSPEEEQQGCSQILLALNARDSIGQSSGVAAMPPGFLERFADQFEEEESFPGIIGELTTFINTDLLQRSLMGDFQAPLQNLLYLASVPPIARVMTKLDTWAPQLRSGREVQTKTVLGPALSITSLPDIDWHFGKFVSTTQPQPNVALTLFRNAETRSAEVAKGLESVRLTLQGLHTTQWNIIMAFLKQKATREPMLKFLALALELNKEHTKEMPDITSAAPRGMMLNLSAVLLKVCEPFLDPSTGKAWGKLDSRYTQLNDRLDYTEETRLHFSPEEQKAWEERVSSGAEAEALGSFTPHFICECYFMTGKALHMGYSKLFTHFTQLQRMLRNVKEEVQFRRDRLDQMTSMPPHVVAIAKRELQGMEDRENSLTGTLLCIQAEMMERKLTDGAFAFYNLTADWLLRLASPSYATTSTPDVQLPAEAPLHFRILPEYLVSDMVELLRYATHYPELGQAMASASTVKTTVLFITTFMPAGAYINNIYLRAQLGEILSWLLPEAEDPLEGYMGRARRRTSPINATVTALIETLPALHSGLITNLLKIFVEVERTGRHNQFYEKFNVRLDLGRILLYLWNVPTYRDIWVRLAVQDEDLYSRFNYFLETDATHTLDEALKFIEEEKEYQALERDERQRQANLQGHQQRVQHLGFDLRFAKSMLLLINVTTAVIWQPWLSSQAVKRIAGTLNYFLKYLTGPERARLSVKDDKKEINFDPKDLLTQIATIYVHLSRRDKAGLLAQAIVADKRSYYTNMFPDALKVLGKFGLLPAEELQELNRLSQKTAEAVQALKEEEQDEADAPEEFFDPIMSDIMSDPVILPSGIVMDSENIKRHLMSDATDPFSRLPLTAAELKPHEELKARIQEWKARNRNKAQPIEE